MKAITNKNVIRWRKCALEVFNRTTFEFRPNGSMDVDIDVSAMLELERAGWEMWIKPMQPRFLKMYQDFQKTLSIETLQMIEGNFTTELPNRATIDYLNLMSDYLGQCGEIIEEEINYTHVRSAFLDAPSGSKMSLITIMKKKLTGAQAAAFFTRLRVQFPRERIDALRMALPVFDDHNSILHGPDSTLDNFIRGIAAKTLKEKIDKQNADKFSAREAEQQPASKPAKRELL